MSDTRHYNAIKHFEIKALFTPDVRHTGTPLAMQGRQIHNIVLLGCKWHTYKIFEVLRTAFVYRGLLPSGER